MTQPNVREALEAGRQKTRHNSQALTSTSEIADRTPVDSRVVGEGSLQQQKWADQVEEYRDNFRFDGIPKSEIPTWARKKSNTRPCCT